MYEFHCLDFSCLRGLSDLTRLQASRKHLVKPSENMEPYQLELLSYLLRDLRS
jgi:hypothetical protein